jgi:hypothetical protein
MQYVQYIRLAVMLLSLVKGIRTEGVDNEGALLNALALLVPELGSDEVRAVIPELKVLVGLIGDLRAKS